MEQLQLSNHGPWYYIGDFNAIIGSHEMRGSHLPFQASCAEFKQWSDSCNLIHLETVGAQYTWSNGRKVMHHTEKILDRSLCNVAGWISGIQQTAALWLEVSLITSFSCCLLL